jgi:hypothetical protein
MSGGNPLFTRKFVHALLFMGLLKVEEEEVEPVEAHDPPVAPRKERSLKGIAVVAAVWGLAATLCWPHVRT